MSCDARIRPFRPITDLEVVCEDVEPAHGYHHGTIRDYAYPGSATELGWYSSDRRGFTGDWPGPCTAKQGCILPARHLGKHAQ